MTMSIRAAAMRLEALAMRLARLRYERPGEREDDCRCREAAIPMARAALVGMLWTLEEACRLEREKLQAEDAPQGEETAEPEPVVPTEPLPEKVAGYVSTQLHA